MIEFCVCRASKWSDIEMYVILILIILYSHICVVLIFGLGHCISIICGKICSSYLSCFTFWLDRCHYKRCTSWGRIMRESTMLFKTKESDGSRNLAPKARIIPL